MSKAEQTQSKHQATKMLISKLGASLGTDTSTAPLRLRRVCWLRLHGQACQQMPPYLTIAVAAAEEEEAAADAADAGGSNTLIKYEAGERHGANCVR
eukprot:COSAG05_NODE_1232_length_5441_cov_9.615500_6_plen_97_part_00